MFRLFKSAFVLFLCAHGLAGERVTAQGLLPIPVGSDAYLQWEKWPQQRLGVRAYMRSTYDRTGGNEGADASHFLYQEAEDFNVTLDVMGAGCLYFARYNHWHGSPWHYEIDGQDYLLRETSTADPDHPVPQSVFEPTAALPNTLTWTWSETKGADLMWVPMPFSKRFRMAYSRTHYGTGYYIYHLMQDRLPTSRELIPWSPQQNVPGDVLDLLGKAGTSLVEPVDRLSRVDHPLQITSGSQTVSRAHPLKLRIDAGSIVVRGIEFEVPVKQVAVLENANLKITWDDRQHPSVDTPLPLFFGTGTFYNRDDREYLVKAFPVNVRYTEDRLQVACYFPMPAFKSVDLRLTTKDEVGSVISYRLIHERSDWLPRDVGYFHATYVDHETPKLGHDLIFLDTRQIEGEEHWSGSFIGTSFVFTDRNNLTTLEGDPRFYFDDALSPQCYGTGTEEWGGGGDYWGGRNMTLPFAGHPVGAPSRESAHNQQDQVHSAYRFLLADLMPFGKNARITFEHGGLNQSTEHYRSISYWYGSPAASLVLTDQLDIGDLESEQAHHYHSPDASEVETIESRFEWGPDSYVSQASPKATANNFADFEFDADADTDYFIYVLGRSLADNLIQDSIWLQFNQDIGSGQAIGLDQGQPGLGNWRDDLKVGQWGWASFTPHGPVATVRFDETGKQKLRLLPRQMPCEIQAIWLSREQSQVPAGAELPEIEGTGDRLLLPGSAENLVGGIRQISDSVIRIDGEGDQLVYPKGFQSPRTPEPEIFPGMGAFLYQPPIVKKGRHTKGSTEFEAAVRKDNFGLLLRRCLDYRFAGQRANVYVADATRTEANRDWKWVGEWYLAGSSRYIYSNPRSELGATEAQVYQSNRHLREDEFMVPVSATQGLSRVAIRLEYRETAIPLLPGNAAPASAWSEIRYDIYSIVRPDFQVH